MARRDYLPLADKDLLAYTANFAAIISADPVAYNLTDLIFERYVELQAEYAARLQASLDPLTEGRRTVFLKNESKKRLVDETRRIARQIGNLISVTDDQRQALGLTIRSDRGSSINPPSVAPAIKVVRVDGRTITLELRQATGRRGKPAGAAGATVFTHVGPLAPASMEQWQFAASVTRSSVELPFGPSHNGDTVWMTAFWTNAKGQAGPAAKAQSVDLPAGGATPAERGEAARLKIAA